MTSILLIAVMVLIPQQQLGYTDLENRLAGGPFDDYRKKSECMANYQFHSPKKLFPAKLMNKIQID